MALDLLSLFEVLMGSIVPPETPPAAKDMIVFGVTTGMLQGNWEPLERTREPVKAFLGQAGLQSTPQRQVVTEELVNRAISDFSTDGNTNMFIAENLTSGDPLEVTSRIAKEHLRWVIDGYMDYAGTPQLPFSAALRGTLISFCGSWYVAVSPLFPPGKADAFMELMLEYAKRLLLQRDPANVMKAEMIGGLVKQFYVTLRNQYLQERGMPCPTA